MHAPAAPRLLFLSREEPGCALAPSILFVEPCHHCTDCIESHAAPAHALPAVLFMGVCTRPYLAIVSEYMARGSLFRLLHRGGSRPLPPKLQRSVAVSVARGMAYLHSRSPPLLHLDLKSPKWVGVGNSEAVCAAGWLRLWGGAGAGGATALVQWRFGAGGSTPSKALARPQPLPVRCHQVAGATSRLAQSTQYGRPLVPACPHPPAVLQHPAGRPLACEDCRLWAQPAQEHRVTNAGHGLWHAG